MKKRVLLVCVNNQNFLVSAMSKKIQEAGYEVITSRPDVTEISTKIDCPDIFLVYLEGDLEGFSHVLTYLKDLMSNEDKDRVVYIIGTQLELNAAYDVLPKTLVTASFLRPFNVTDIINKLNIVVNEEDGKINKKKILVVDDDPMLLRTMNMWLSNKYEVYMANSGANAIALLSQKEVDLILLDYEMPVISGAQVFEMIKAEQRTSTIPIIFLTAKSDKDTVLRLLSLKPEKYLLKTLPPEELLTNIDNFFKGK